MCINKIDRPEARPDEVIDEVLELLMDLDASDEQLDCPFLYASAKAGHAVLDLNDTPENMVPLFETILKYIPAPTGDPKRLLRPLSAPLTTMNTWAVSVWARWKTAL